MPITPTAKDRYREGNKEFDINGDTQITRINGPRKINNWHPATIKQIVTPSDYGVISTVNYEKITSPNDTIYVEVPGSILSEPLINITPRTGSVKHYFTDEDFNRAIKSRKLIATGRDVNGDYETLKRRFNEASKVVKKKKFGGIL